MEADIRPVQVTRNRISIDSKLLIIDLIENNFATRAQLARQYNMSKSTISKIMKSKKVIKSNTTAAFRCRKLKYYELEAPLLSFIKEMQSTGQKVNGNTIRAEATRLGQEFGLIGFKASNGWLYKFQRRFLAQNGFDFRDPLGTPATESTFKPELIKCEPEDDEEPDIGYQDDVDEVTMVPSQPIPPQSEIESALNTIKSALEACADVPFNCWQAFFEIKVFLSEDV